MATLTKPAMTNFFNSPVRDMGFYVELSKWDGWIVRVQYAPAKTIKISFLHAEEQALAQAYITWFEAQ